MRCIGSRWFPSDPGGKRDHLDQDEAPDLAMRTAGAVGVGDCSELRLQRRTAGRRRFGRFAGRYVGRGEQRACDLEPETVGGAEEPRVTHLGEALGQDVGQEAADELLAADRGGLGSPLRLSR